MHLSCHSNLYSRRVIEESQGAKWDTSKRQRSVSSQWKSSRIKPQAVPNKMLILADVGGLLSLGAHVHSFRDVEGRTVRGLSVTDTL
jgi:hypothetical protein